MHTVNKAYALLRAEGLLRLDRRTGAVIAVDMDKLAALTELKDNLRLVLAKAACKGVKCDEVHKLVDEIYGLY